MRGVEIDALLRSIWNSLPTLDAWTHNSLIIDSITKNIVMPYFNFFSKVHSIVRSIILDIPDHSATIIKIIGYFV